MAQLVEFTKLEGSADETNVFRNVKILGLKSQNGYSYDAKAVEKAAPLYENAPVYIDHVKGARSYADRIGFIQNPRIQEQELYGDFVLNPKHKLAEQVLWDAEHGTTGVGFSHRADGALNKKTGIVESITSVLSVDIVASPATVTNFFESMQEEAVTHDKLEELSKQNDELKLQLAEVVKQVNELQTKTKTKPQAIVPVAVEATKDSYSDFLKRIKR